jgi:hypothetical protein
MLLDGRRRSRAVVPNVPALPSAPAVRLRALGVLAIATMLGGCVKPYDPFRIPSFELRDRVRTIAVAPLEVSSTLVDRSYTRAEIEPMVTERLRAGGFTIVPSDEMEVLWRRAAGDVGGIFDPVTGAADKERFTAVGAAVHRDLAWSPVDYCGTRSDVYWPGGFIPFEERATIVLVLCLNTGLYDLEGRELYGIRHGLEAIETYLGQTRAVRPMNERLRDRERLVQAVDATLGPLVKAGSAK